MHFRPHHLEIDWNKMSQLCPVARRFNYSSIRSKAPFFPSSELIFHSVCSRCMAPLLLTSPKSLVSGFAIKPDALCMRLRLSRHTQQRPQQLVNELASSGGVDGKLICWKWSSLSLSLFFSPSLGLSLLSGRLEQMSLDGDEIAMGQLWSLSTSWTALAEE